MDKLALHDVWGMGLEEEKTREDREKTVKDLRCLDPITSVV
jgi:hypothetical protein